jgi:hypothetical protein
MSTTTVDRTGGPASVEGAATRAFSASMLISATRCLLTYVVFPWVLPVLGVAGGVGPGVGLVVGAVALASNAVSIRRFWAADHRWKWPITVLNVGVIALVSTFVADDVAALL